MRKKKIQILLSVAVFFFLMDGAIPVKAQERKLGRKIFRESGQLIKLWNNPINREFIRHFVFWLLPRTKRL